MRLHLDTSVFGALFDPERWKVQATRSLLDGILARRWEACGSRVVLEEIAEAPAGLRARLLGEVARARLALLAETGESLALAQAYLSERALPRSARADARHVAIATVHRVDALASWNFRHLVNLRRRRLVHAVNIRLGYPLIEVVSPQEVELDV